jgi:hypothetical protein
MQNRKLKIFISMPFSGKQFEALYQERLDLKALVESYGFELTEQFVGYQFKEDFESKDYDPKWVVGKDKNWLKQSDVEKCLISQSMPWCQKKSVSIPGSSFTAADTLTLLKML